MPRHKLTREQRLRGLRKALASPKTPKQFKASLRKQIAKLSEGRG
jgi:hypothetical protein